MRLIRYCGIVLLSGVSVLVAQDVPKSSESAAPGKATLTLKSTVRRVVVDVVATDRKGYPVTNLHAQDFSILEDGKPQPISSFDVYQEPVHADESLTRDKLPPNTFTNFSRVPAKAPINVILLDLLNTSLIDQMYAYQAAVKFAEQLPPGKRTAVFILKDKFRIAVGVTEDRAQVLASLHNKAAWPYLSGLGSYGRARLTIESFNRLSRFLSAMPERKNLIWLSDSFLYTAPDSLFGGEASLSGFGIGGGPQSWGVQSYSTDMKESAALLSIGQIAIYPIDVRGLSTHASFGGEAPARGGGGDGRPTYVPQPTRCQTPGLCRPSISDNALQIEVEELAKQSGGRAFLNENRPQLAMMEAVVNGSNYYSISYAPSNTNFDGSLRKIKVEVAGKDLQLEYRRSYVADDPASLIDDEPDPLFKEASHGLPLSHNIVFVAGVNPQGVPVRATPDQMEYLANFEVTKLALALKYDRYKKRLKKARPGKPVPIPSILEPVDLQHYAIDYALPLRELALTPAPGGKRRVHLDFVAIAYDADGRKLTGDLGNVDDLLTTERFARLQKSGYHARQEMDIPVKAASVRLAVRDATGGQLGSLEIALPLAPAVTGQKE